MGVNYFDNDTNLEFVTTRLTEHNGMIVAYQAPVLLTGRTSREEKFPIHVADVIRMKTLSIRLESLGEQLRLTSVVIEP